MLIFAESIVSMWQKRGHFMIVYSSISMAHSLRIQVYIWHFLRSLLLSLSFGEVGQSDYRQRNFYISHKRKLPYICFLACFRCYLA